MRLPLFPRGLRRSAILVLLLLFSPGSAPVSANAEDACGLTSHLPHDVTPEASRADFEHFSWQSFVALNWPAETNGRPSSGPIGTDPEAARVWEFYRSPDSVFLPDGGRPFAHARDPIPEACRGQLPDSRLESLGRVVRMTSKASHVIAAVTADLEAVVNRPLVDQNLNFILAEIRLNPDEFGYIVENRLYDAQVQKDWKYGPIDLPEGSPGGPVGAIEVKAAWRFLDPERDRDILGRYYTERSLVYVHPQNTVDGEPLCLDALLGLVGFHISHKTKTRPEWIWSTFEQVDNVRRGPGLPEHRTPTLRDPRCNSRYMCPVNQAPPSPFAWNRVTPYAIEVPATQVLRDLDLPPWLERINDSWQEKLRCAAPDTVWQYYELVGTQYPSHPDRFDPEKLAFGDPVPTTLANTTMETYLQPTSSCIQCHGARATLTDNPRTFPDFSFLFAHACYRLEQEISLVQKPCAALLLGQVDGYTQDDRPILDPVAIGPDLQIGTRRIEVMRTAGTFQLVCDADAPEVDVTITSSGNVPFASGTSVTLNRPGPNRFALQAPGPPSSVRPSVAFVLDNSGEDTVRVACTLEPF